VLTAIVITFAITVYLLGLLRAETGAGHDPDTLDAVDKMADGPGEAGHGPADSSQPGPVTR
jgi:hypothetical protein